jgi:hypothetical protein
MTAIELLKLQAKLANAEHLIDQVNWHLASKPLDAEMREARHLLADAALRLRQQLKASTHEVIRI